MIVLAVVRLTLVVVVIRVIVAVIIVLSGINDDVVAAADNCNDAGGIANDGTAAGISDGDNALRTFTAWTG